jgi:hypothetical protein
MYLIIRLFLFEIKFETELAFSIWRLYTQNTSKVGISVLMTPPKCQSIIIDFKGFWSVTPIETSARVSDKPLLVYQER